MGPKVVWRFYAKDGSGWTWQQLSTDGTVIAESPTPYSDYAACLAAASNEGYLHEASQGRATRPGGGMRWGR